MLEIKNLSYRFGEKQVLSDISLDIADGSFYAVMGANGCGKTTLLRCMDAPHHICTEPTLNF